MSHEPALIRRRFDPRGEHRPTFEVYRWHGSQRHLIGEYRSESDAVIAANAADAAAGLDRDPLDELVGALASGTLAPNASRPVLVPLRASGDTEGTPNERGTLEALQAAGIVSDDVRSCHIEVTHEHGSALLTVIDTDSEDAIAWLRIPLGAGA